MTQKENNEKKPQHNMIHNLRNYLQLLIQNVEGFDWLKNPNSLTLRVLLVPVHKGAVAIDVY